MTRKEIFTTVKEANAIVDQMNGLAVNSKEYNDLNQALGWTLDSLMTCRSCSLHMSKQTGHYFVRFA